MRSFTRRRDDHAKTVLARGAYKRLHRLRRTVRRIDMHRKRNLQFLQRICRSLDDRKIAVTPHNNRYFFHFAALLFSFCFYLLLSSICAHFDLCASAVILVLYPLCAPAGFDQKRNSGSDIFIIIPLSEKSTHRSFFYFVFFVKISFRQRNSYFLRTFYGLCPCFVRLYQNCPAYAPLHRPKASHAACRSPIC